MEDPDVGRFDRWSARYDRSPFQPMFFRKVHTWVAEALSATEGERVLDVGCGTGLLAERLADRADGVVGVDPAPGMIRRACERNGRRSLFAVGAAEHLPFADGAFDAAVTAVSAHHWQDASAGVAELHRIVRARGRVVVADVGRLGPVLDGLRKMFLGKAEHHHGWEERELGDLLYRAGFRGIRSNRTRAMGVPIVILLARR